MAAAHDIAEYHHGPMVAQCRDAEAVESVWRGKCVIGAHGSEVRVEAADGTRVGAVVAVLEGPDQDTPPSSVGAISRYFVVVTSAIKVFAAPIFSQSLS